MRRLERDSGIRQALPRIARCGDQLSLQCVSASAEIDTTRFPREGTRQFVQCVLSSPPCRASPASMPPASSTTSWCGGSERTQIVRADADRADFVARRAPVAAAGALPVYAWALLHRTTAACCSIADLRASRRSCAGSSRATALPPTAAALGRASLSEPLQVHRRGGERWVRTDERIPGGRGIRGADAGRQGCAMAGTACSGPAVAAVSGPCRVINLTVHPNMG